MKKSKISIACLEFLAQFLWNDIKTIYKISVVGDCYSYSIVDGDELVYTNGKPYCIINGVIGYMDEMWVFQPKSLVVGEYVFVTDKGFHYVEVIK